MKLAGYASKFFSGLLVRQGLPAVARRGLGGAVGLALLLTLASGVGAQQARYQRKYKPLPQLAHIVVLVEKGFDGKPMPNVPVVFHSTFEGRDNGNMEIKTDPHGNATMDLIQVGSDVDVQVIATGYATFSQDLQNVGAKASMVAKMIRPREQVSQWLNADGKPASVQPGIQEPPHPALAPPKPNVDGFALPPSSSSSGPASAGSAAQQAGAPTTQTGTPQ
ncbi:MAG: hypothetical protein ACP5E5_04015 [Acidobacteriaceae bacterium]